MTDTDYRARVEAGMAFLDREVPGWERSIDLGTLSLSNPCACVLDQAMRERARRARWVGSDGRPHGFVYGINRLAGPASSYGFVAMDYGDYPRLEAEWRTAIKARFDSGVLSDDVVEVRPA